MPQLSREFCRLGTGLINARVMPDGGGTAGVAQFQAACNQLR